MIVGPRYNDVDPAVEAAYQRAAETETASRIDDIAARLEAATPGPWEAVLEYPEDDALVIYNPDASWVAAAPLDEDADLIAHAPADIAALLAVVREVAELHRPDEQNYAGTGPVRCGCGALEVVFRDDGPPILSTVAYPCPTATAVAALTEETTDAG